MSCLWRCLPVAVALALASPSLAGVTHLPPPGPSAPGAVDVKPQSFEPPVAVVVAGSTAPDFSWQDADRRWLRLHDVLGQGHALVVFAPEEADLRRLERDRDALLDLGVVPVAVVELRAGAAWSLARRLNLRFGLVPDPRGVVAAQFNVLDPRTRSTVPAWFVVDRAGRVRGLDRGRMPEAAWSGVAIESLALPAPGAPRPAVAR